MSFSQNRFPLLQDVLLTERHPHRDQATRLRDGEPLRGHTSDVNSAAFSPDGKHIVTASDDETARLWDAESGKPIGEPLRGHEGWVLSAAFSPDGKRIATALCSSWAKPET
jgi:WD40 repeat protein